MGGYTSKVRPSREHNAIVLRDGRDLGYAEYGDPDGIPVFYFHGSPGSRLEAGFLGDAAARGGVRLIGVDRPGYGLSSFRKHRRLLDWPEDVVQLADALGIERFAVAGLSGGGPHVAACARMIPERVLAAAIISGAGPLEASFTPDMGRVRRALIRFGARVMPFLARPLMWWAAVSVRRLPWTMPRYIDARVMSSPQHRAAFKRDVVEAFRHGSRGAAQEYASFPKPWGFRPDDIATHVDLWHGDADVIVPVRVGRYMAAAIPDCAATFYPGEGHLLFVDHTEEIIAAIRASARAPARAATPAPPRFRLPG